MTQRFISSKNIWTEDSVLFPELKKYLDSYLWPHLIYVDILTQMGY